ncbi:MAG: glycosyltransferase family 4 protein [Bacteroidetes bacterium]|nr:glycosyltransferase family 4 protein [Bacteroidota bacterium]
MDSRRLHIAFCTDGIFPLNVGGIQRHSRLLIEELARKYDLEISVIHPHTDKLVFNNPAIKEYDIDIKFNSKVYALNCARYSKTVLEIVEKINPDIIYAQGLAVYSGIKKVGYKTIINPHGLEPYQGLTLRDKISTYPLRIYQNKIFQYAAKIISLGGGLSDVLVTQARVPEEKIITIPNAVAHRPYASKDYSVPVMRFLFVGRFAHNKGIDVLLKVISKLNKNGYQHKCEFNLVGKGPLYENLKSAYALPNVIYHGFADDLLLEKLYRECHIFVFPTLFEGMPTVVLEAMIHSMPIIVSDVGATSTQVDKSNGYLIQKNNQDQLYRSIVDFINLPLSKRALMSQASYNKVAGSYTWEIVARQHYDFFRLFHQSIA